MGTICHHGEWDTNDDAVLAPQKQKFSWFYFSEVKTHMLVCFWRGVHLF